MKKGGVLQPNEKDKLIIQKEQELNKILNEYYNFDMTELKKDVEKVLYTESERIQKEKDDRLREIQNNFKRVMSLSKEHIQAEPSFKSIEQIEDKELIQTYEKQNEVFEKTLKDTNAQRQLLRNEITALEVELRKLRDTLADKQFENKNLNVILQKEEELKKHKTVLESKALKSLSDEISVQLSELQSNSEKITGKITPFGMEQTLQDIMKKIIADYEKFIEESEKDVKDTQKEVDKLRRELEKEKMISESLQRDVDGNNKELEKQKEIFKKYKAELDDMVWKHNHRLKSLEEIRTAANEDIKRISIELSAVQSEINVLILEAQKYEGYLEFLVAEREMILKAQLESDDVDPLFQAEDLLQADIKRKKIEEQIDNIEKDWKARIEKIRDEMERILTENEMKEYRSRLAVLTAELNDKNQQVEKINQDTLDLEETGERALLIGMENQQQQQEIEVLNEKYKTALREKVEIYDEFTESLKELCNRNARFLKNVIETSRVVSETNIMKKELDQKEKNSEDIRKEIIQVTQQDERLLQKIDERVQDKQNMLKKFRQDLRDKDGMVEFMEFVLKDKQRSINELQFQFQEQGKPKQADMQKVVRPHQRGNQVIEQRRTQMDVLQTMKRQLEDVLNQLDEERQEYDQTKQKRKQSPEAQRRAIQQRDFEDKQS